MARKRTTFAVFATAASVSMFSVTHAADAAFSDDGDSPELIRSTNHDGADIPSGRLLLRIPSSEETIFKVPPTEGGEPPVEPGNSYNGEEDNPPFCGEPIGDRCLFIIDVSDSMLVSDVGNGEDYNGNIVSNMNRLLMVKTELINLLRSVDNNFWFDIIWLAGGNVGQCELPNTDVWQGQLVECTDEIRDAAVQEVIDQVTWFGTPTWEALRIACTLYPHNLSTLVLLTDGAPFPRGVPGDWGPDQIPAIFQDFPGWFAPKKADGCKLVGIHIGQNLNAGDFMQAWCAQNDVSYTHK